MKSLATHIFENFEKEQEVEEGFKTRIKKWKRNIKSSTSNTRRSIGRELKNEVDSVAKDLNPFKSEDD